MWFENIFRSCKHATFIAAIHLEVDGFDGLFGDEAPDPLTPVERLATHGTVHGVYSAVRLLDGAVAGVQFNRTLFD